MKKRNSIFAIFIAALMIFTMMPMTQVYAAYDSTYWKGKMDEAEQKINQYTAQLATDQAALDAATNSKNSAEVALNTAADNLDAAENALDQRSSDYIYSKIIEAWSNDVARLKATDNYTFNYYNNKISNFETQGFIMYSDDYLIDQVSTSNNSLIKSVLSTYNTTYGPDSFRESFIDTQGYFNTLEALENIDRCNAIRADRTELAKFYVDVLGQSVPDNVPQLKISPYLMKISAVNVALNGTGKIAHIYGACTNYGNTGIAGVTAFGQNVIGGRFGDNTQIVNPFEGWWTTENHNGTVSHNKTLSNPEYTATGFAISNPNKITGIAVAGQDFINPNYSGYTFYTASEYRSGLISYCASALSTYNSKLAAYNDANTAYQSAKSVYDSAKAAYDATAGLLSSARADYNRYKEQYEAALENEQSNTYTIRFRDGLTDELLLQKTVTKGSYVTPPTPPTHAGYEFTGWDSNKYQNVTQSFTIVALYSPIQTGGDTTYYTIKFKDGLNYLVFSTQNIQAGKDAVPPTPPTHAGYTFTGWSSTAYLNVHKNTVITALYIKNDSNISSSSEPASSEQPSSKPASSTPASAAYVGGATEGASAAAVTRYLTTRQDDSDAPGSTYSKLTARVAKARKTSQTISWQSVPGAVKYNVYGNQCGKANKLILLGSVAGTSYDHTMLKKGTYYKYMVVAVDKNGKVAASSRMIHSATAGGKIGNFKKVKTSAKKNKVNLKAGKKFKLKAKGVKGKGKVKKHRAICYESSNPAIATVTGKGVIKGVSPGQCIVYAYAQNGVFAKIKVIIK